MSGYNGSFSGLRKCFDNYRFTCYYYNMYNQNNRVGGIRTLWKAHADIRSGVVSELLGTETSKAIAETADELGRREGQIELRPTSSPARSLDCKLPSVP